MKRLFSILLCILILLSCAVPVLAADGVPQEVMEATKSVVRILSEYKRESVTGSGFVIKNDGTEILIATNDHVVENNPKRISVWVGEDRQVDAEIVFTTSGKDLCVLRLTEFVDMVPLTLSEEEAQHGAAIYAVGYPGAGDVLSDTQAHTSDSVTITDGIISAIRSFTIEKGAAPVKLLQVNAAINAGNSGGPLFNTRGEVIGVNTYKVNVDSQGVFGSVDISELWGLLEEHNIVLVEEIPETEPLPTEETVPVEEPAAVPAGGIAIGAGVLVLILGMLILAAKKKKKVTLLAYMNCFPQGMDAHEAVSMLLPVAIQLRNLHNDGKLHLQVSPETILISPKGAFLKDPSKKETERHNSGFAAPEVYKGAGYGVASDLYSFAAVLLYTVTGKTPVNSLQREVLDGEIAALEEMNPGFGAEIRNALALLPQDRTQSMQELIYRFSAFNDREFRMTKMKKAKAPKQKKREPKKRNGKVKGIAVAAVLVIAFMAAALLWKPYVQPQIDARQEAERQEAAYLAAVALMEEGNYAEAMEAFAVLEGYRDSDTHRESCRIAIENAILEEKYREAEALSAEGKHAHAGIAFAKLGEYKDSRDRSFGEWAKVRTCQIVDVASNFPKGACYLGLKEDGTVILTGGNWTYCDAVSDWQDIVSVTLCSTVPIGVKADGTVVYGRDVNYEAGEWMKKTRQWTDIVSVLGSGRELIGLKKDGTVVWAQDETAWDADPARTSQLSEWTDVIDLFYTSWDYSDNGIVGLRTDGTVVGTNLPDGVAQWENIVQLESSVFWNNNFLIGICADGSVQMAGKYDERGTWITNDTYQSEAGEHYGKIEGWTDIVDVTDAVGLHSDGRVSVLLEAAVPEEWREKINSWTDIAALYGDSNFIYGLKTDGTVVSAGAVAWSGREQVTKWKEIAGIFTNYEATIGIKRDGTIEIAKRDANGDVRKWKNIRIP